MTDRALVIQGRDLLIRGFLAAPPHLRAPDGTPSNALFAAVKAVRRALAFKTPTTAIAWVPDASDPTWPAEVAAQVEGLTPLLESHGIVVRASSDPTGDAARAIHRARADGADAMVVGYDKRLAQLVADDVWFYDAYKDVRYTPELVKKRFGVPPSQVAEWLALVGDSGYATPGIKGIGQKGAVTLLEEYGSVSAALDALDGIKGRAGNALRAAVDAVPGAVSDATLPIEPVTDALPGWSAPSTAQVDAFYTAQGFFSLLSASAEPTVETEICRDAAAIGALVAQLGPAPVSVYALTGGPSPVRGGLVGLGLSDGEARNAYVPADLLHELQAWLEDPDAPKVGHDIKSATVTLARRGITLRGIVGDSGIASHTLDPSGSAPHELEPLAKVHLHEPLAGADATLGRGKARKTWRSVAVEKAAAFAASHARAAHGVWRHLAPHAAPEPMAEALELAEVLVRMEQRGMPCDAEDLAASGQDFERIGAELEAEIFALAGKTFTINSTKQLGSVLFEDLKLPIVSRTKTGWSTANHALERIESAHPIVPLVMRWRRLRRLTDSWVTALIAAISPDGRVRSTFHPARSFSGRLVNSHPDLGRVPGRTPEMARIRRAFRAPDGWQLLSIDYDQLGLYVLAHLSEDPNLVGPLERGEDIHTATAKAVLETDTIGPDERQIGKVVNFATFAGQGSSALALQLGVSAKESKTLIARFDKRYAGVRDFQAEQLRLAQETGRIHTIAGRPWPIGDLDSKDPRDRSYAIRLARRATHEGSVADVTRRGLLHADRALRTAGLKSFPLVQIHDEVLFEVPDGELDAVIEHAGAAMREAFDLRVPLRVGFKSGPNWADLLAV